MKIGRLHKVIKSPDLCFQKMNLVVSHEDKRLKTTDLYLIDELYELFAPHIDEVKAKIGRAFCRERV